MHKAAYGCSTRFDSWALVLVKSGDYKVEIH